MKKIKRPNASLSIHRKGFFATARGIVTVYRDQHWCGDDIEIEVVEDTIEVEFETHKGLVYTLEYSKLRPANQERIVELLQEMEDPDMDPPPPPEHEPYEDCGFDRKYGR